MAILAGIDEAGFGPLLGPLVVSGVAFRVPDDHLDRCLWRTLRSSCTATPKNARQRVVVADSKQLHRSRGGLERLSGLERAALVMLTVTGDSPRTFRALLNRLSPGATDQLDHYPWYAGRSMALPLSGRVGDIPTQANAVRRDCMEHNVTIHGVYSEPLLEGHFNRLVKNTRNKAVVLLGLALRVIDRVIQSAGDERIRVCVDRLGGRIRYREALTTAMPGYELRILEESPTRSAYRMVRTSRVCELEFVTGGEGRHFAIALASIYSKYLRELYMYLFNAYWTGQVAGLRPTAGYYTDAKRWLSDVSTELDNRSIDRSTLVRLR